MVDREELKRLEALMTVTYRRMTSARAAGDWASYWALRRTWLSIGRMYTELAGLHRDFSEGQLMLLANSAGREHDHGA
jgi:hypothetical protein